VRPLLLLLVFGAFLAVIGATATGQALLVTVDGSANYLSSRVQADGTIVRSLVNLHLQAADVRTVPLPAERQAVLDRQLELITDEREILQAAILTPGGLVLAASDATAVGQTRPADQGFSDAVTTRAVDATIADPTAARTLGPVATDSILREYFPVIADGTVYAVVAVWRDAAPIFARLDESRIHVVVITLTAALVTAVLLYLIFRSAQGRLTRQTHLLLESTRRDPLTGLLNHGAVVEALSERIDAARTNPHPVALAILDIDNFGLLNDTYGHAAGDRALLEVERLLAEALPSGTTVGRYGPDEFLAITSSSAAAAPDVIARNSSGP